MKLAQRIHNFTKTMHTWTTSLTVCAKTRWNSARIGSILITLTSTQSQNVNIRRSISLQLKQIKKWLASELPFPISWKNCKLKIGSRMKKCWKLYLLRSKRIAQRLNATLEWKLRHLQLLSNQVALSLPYQNCQKMNQTLDKCSILFSIQWSTLNRNFSSLSQRKTYRP